MCDGWPELAHTHARSLSIYIHSIPISLPSLSSSLRVYNTSNGGGLKQQQKTRQAKGRREKGGEAGEGERERVMEKLEGDS